MIEPGIDPFDGQAVFENVLRARIQGFETSTIVEIFPKQLTLTFNYTYIWARDLENNIALKYRPRHLFYASLDFSEWNFDFGIDFRYWSKVEEIDDELVDLGIVRDGEQGVPVYVTDFRAGYNLMFAGLPLRLFINVKNLFNYNYIELIGNIRKIRSYSFGFNLAI
jgi:outer membrane receptor protein involved in Fe transport